ncbi:helix-turn-helix transcriptional regulator [Dokdonella soli]|uniref:Helix-turn-helix transcriptional regulator n=2 Tax=Dokdonella soli TaxID=529810 RepID=A0ABP3TKN8_9GAMM
MPPARSWNTRALATLPDRIRHVRRLNRLTQAALAKRIGVGPSAVAQWELPGGTSPTVENLIKIALSGEVSFEWLATGRGPLRSEIHQADGVDAFPTTMDRIEDRLLSAFRRLKPRKRELFVHCMEEIL